MNLRIRPFRDDDMEDIVRLSLSAWAPVFDMFRQMMGPKSFTVIWPDWKKSQAEAVEKVCRENEKARVLVAELDGKVAGFLAYELKHEEKIGEVQYLAVDPDYQNRGIGTELNRFVLGIMRESGMKLAAVATGGDPAHAPARRSYEKAGYRPVPQVWYIQDLQEPLKTETRDINA